MHVFRGLQNSERRHWSDEFKKKSGQFFSEILAPGILGPLTATPAL